MQARGGCPIRSCWVQQWMNKEINGYLKTFYQNLYLSSARGWFIIASIWASQLTVTTHLILTTSWRHISTAVRTPICQVGNWGTEAELLSHVLLMGCVRQTCDPMWLLLKLWPSWGVGSCFLILFNYYFLLSLAPALCLEYGRTQTLLRDFLT